MTISHSTKNLMTAIAAGDLLQVRSLIAQEDCNCKHHGSKPLRDAVKTGRIDIVQELLPHSDPQSFHCDALTQAAKLGRLDLIDLLLAYISSSSVPDQAMGEAVVHNHYEVFDRMLPRVVHDTKLVDLLIMVSAQYGRERMLEALLPHRSNPVALKWAVRARSPKCVELLLPVSDISEDFFVAWRDAFNPMLSAEIIEMLIPHVDVNMFNHFALVWTLLSDNILLAQKLFFKSEREKVLTDVITEIQNIQCRSHVGVNGQQAVSTIEQCLNEEQKQRLLIDAGHSFKATRRKI